MFWSSFGGKPMVTSNHQFFVSLSANYFEWFASNDCRTYPVLNVALFPPFNEMEFGVAMPTNLLLLILVLASFYCTDLQEIMKKTKNHITMVKSKCLWLLPCHIICICIYICLKSVTDSLPKIFVRKCLWLQLPCWIICLETPVRAT